MQTARFFSCMKLGSTTGGLKVCRGIKMNIPVDVIATFNVEGKMKPDYIRLEDEEHMLHTYKIDSVEYTKEEAYAGINRICFVCQIIVDDCIRRIKLYYFLETHKWTLFRLRL